MIDTTTGKSEGFFSTAMNRDQCKDAAMALVLICLLCALYRHDQRFVAAGVVLLIANMVYPNLFKPFAVLWFGLARLLGTIVSRVLLTIIFFVLVTPVGVVRKMLGADSLQLGKWKKESGSVFKVRDKVFEPEDIARPY